MATRKTSRRKRSRSKKYKADFIREQMRQGRTKKQAEATYKMLRGSARHRRQYKLNPLRRGHAKEIPFEKTSIETWFERDRAHVALENDRTGKTIVEWWDDDVQQAVDDGFLDPRDWHGSAYEYAQYLGLINPGLLGHRAKEATPNGIPGLRGSTAIEDVNIANPSEAEFYGDNRYVREGPLFEMWFGAAGTTNVYVWADGFDSAFEEAVEWLDDEGLCGHFVTLDEGDIVDAAEDIGYSQSRAEKFAKDFFAGRVDWDDDDVSDIIQRAEADLTVIGHTTLNCEKQMGGPLYVPSWEWGGAEVSDPATFKAVLEESLRRDEED